MLLLAGCSENYTVSEQMTDVVVIQNKMPDASAENVTEAAATVKTGLFVEDMDYDIKSFVRQFYDYLASGDYELAMYMTNDSANLDRDKFIQLSGYIDSVKSLTCYMMEGMVDGSYIVVARCGVATTLGSQVVTMLNAFYICTNESGTYYICSSSVGDEVKSYIDNKVLEVEKVEITDLVSDWKIEKNNSVKKGDIVYLDFTITKNSSWSTGWNYGIGKIPILENCQNKYYDLTLNGWEGRNTGEIVIKNGIIDIFELGHSPTGIGINTTVYIGKK